MEYIMLVIPAIIVLGFIFTIFSSGPMEDNRYSSWNENLHD